MYSSTYVLKALMNISTKTLVIFIASMLVIPDTFSPETNL